MIKLHTSTKSGFGLTGHRTPAQVLKDRRGALSVSLPEIGIGLGISVGIGLAVIGSAVAMWSFGQNSSAQSVLGAVQTGQNIVKAETGSYGSLAAITTGTSAKVTNAPASLKIASSANAYCAFVKSDSVTGDTYWITARTGKPVTTMPTATANDGLACPTA